MQFLRTRPDVVGSSERRRDARHVGDTHLSASETSAHKCQRDLCDICAEGGVRRLIDGMVLLRVCEFDVANDNDDSE